MRNKDIMQIAAEAFGMIGVSQQGIATPVCPQSRGTKECGTFKCNHATFKCSGGFTCSTDFECKNKFRCTGEHSCKQTYTYNAV